MVQTTETWTGQDNLEARLMEIQAAEIKLFWMRVKQFWPFGLLAVDVSACLVLLLFLPHQWQPSVYGLLLPVSAGAIGLFALFNYWQKERRHYADRKRRLRDDIAYYNGIIDDIEKRRRKSLSSADAQRPLTQ